MGPLSHTSLLLMTLKDAIVQLYPDLSLFSEAQVLMRHPRSCTRE